MKSVSPLIVFGILFTSMAVPGRSALTDTIWQGSNGANWTTGGNWSNGVAGNTSRAVIDGSLSGGSSVVYNSTTTVGGLSIASGFTFTRGSTDGTARMITINAATGSDSFFNNAGMIVSGGTSGSLTIKLNASGGTLENSGIIEATATTELALQSTSNATILLNNSGGTVRTATGGTLSLSNAASGAVSITGGVLQNASGTINQSKTTAFTDASVSNGGVYNVDMASNTGNPWGISLLGSSTFVNSGTLNLTRNLDATTTVGQSVTFRIDGSSTVSNSGVINIVTHGIPQSNGGAASFSFNISSEVTNNGTINLRSESTTNNANVTILAGGTATFSGTGQMVLAVGSGGAVDMVRVVGSGATLVNSAGHTIRGEGSLGANTLGSISNHGVILADATNALTVNLGGTGTAGTLTNFGTLRSSGGGGLVLADGALNNAGIVQVDQGATMTMQDGSFTSSGDLTVNGTLSSTPNIVLTGGSLRGAGKIAGNVLVSGALAIAVQAFSGHSLTVEGDLAFAASASPQKISLNYGDPAAILNVTGDLNMGSNNAFEFTLGPDAYQADFVYTLIAVGGANNIDLGALSLSASSIAAGYLVDATFGTGGWSINGDGHLDVRFSAVPEPGVWAFLGLGLAAFGVGALRRRASLAA